MHGLCCKDDLAQQRIMACKEFMYPTELYQPHSNKKIIVKVNNGILCLHHLTQVCPTAASHTLVHYLTLYFYDV